MAKLSKSSKALIYIVLMSHTSIIVIPLMWMIFTAFKTQADLVTNPLGIPEIWHFENFVNGWNKSRIPYYFANTSFLILIVYVICIGSASLIAFVLSRFDFKGRNVLYIFFLSGLMVPMHAVIIPVYDMAIKLNTLNNLFYLGLIYSAFFLPLCMVILYGFMAGIPHEIEESAIIDGCNTWTIYLRIIMPMSREGMISAAILTALYCWNDLLLPLVLLNKPEMKTISIGMRTFFAEHYSLPTELIAACFISILPVLILYAFLQEKIVKGMALGAVKG